jgi:hypothetical protein
MAAGLLGRLGHAGFEAALELIGDPAMAVNSRLKAIHAARLAAGDDPALKGRLAEAVQTLLSESMDRARAEKNATPEPQAGATDEEIDDDSEEYDEQDDSSADPRASDDIDAPEAPEWDDPYPLGPTEEVAFLVSDLADLADPRSRDLVKEAFAEDLVDLAIIDEDFVDEQFRKGGGFVEPTWDWLEEYQERYQRHVDWKNRPPEPPAWTGGRPLHVEESEPIRPVETIRNTGPKRGRNDPCWCGSGKKYKKCHLAQDESR